MGGGGACATANVLIKVVWTHLSDADRTYATSADYAPAPNPDAKKQRNCNCCETPTRSQTKDLQQGTANRRTAMFYC